MQVAFRAEIVPQQFLRAFCCAAHTLLVAGEPADKPDGGAMASAVDRFPDVVHVVVEIPRGSRNKYEYDEQTGVFWLDRVLSSAVFYNFDYGYIDDTRADDGDHTDALLLIDEPTFTGCHVRARPVGGLEMRDEKGNDFKVLCVAVGDPHQQHVEELDDVRPHRLIEIEHFFETYKLLEDKTVEVLGWRKRDHARKVLVDDRSRWQAEPLSRR
jgi:inorganic pyrophosphatase